MNAKPEEMSDEREKRGSLYELTRKIMFATLGAAVIAQDEMDSFITHLAERGEIAEKDARRLVNELVERREKLERERRAEQHRTQPGVATKADIDALNARIAELTRKLDEMNQEKK
jgi:polyhydroxyalkanoate synthesis regulator phasin